MEDNFPTNKEIILNSIKKELDDNYFMLSFGITIIILGIISIFYPINDILLIGVSLSSFLFSLVDSLLKNSDRFRHYFLRIILYVLSFSVLLIFCLFPSFPIINYLVDKKLNNFIIFASFGLSFIIDFINGYRNRYNANLELLKQNSDYEELTKLQMQNTIIILEKIYDLKKICLDNKIVDIDLKNKIDELLTYADEESFLSDIRHGLVELGYKNNSDSFTIKEIEDTVILNSSFNRKKLLDKYELSIERNSGGKNAKSRTKK